MFEPNLDLGQQWQSVGTVVAPANTWSYDAIFTLSFRADAMVAKVVTFQNQANWIKGGYIKQVWENNGTQYQITAKTLYMRTHHIIPIEPLATSQIIFVPTHWLINWQIDLYARPFNLTDSISNRLQSIESKIDQLL